MNWLGKKPAAAEHPEARALGFDDFDLKLGDIMRGERATLGKSLLDVQRELRIRAAYITAIENADLSVFDAPSFVGGYVRSYARFLGLDPEWAYAKFCAETGFAVHDAMSGLARPRAPAPVSAKPVPEGLLSRIAIAPKPEPFWRRVEPAALGSVAVLLALICGLGYGAWVVLHEIQRVQLAPADQAPAVLADLDPLSAPGATNFALDDLDLAMALPSAPGSAMRLSAEGSVRVHRPQGLDVPVMEPRDGPIAAIPAQRDPGQMIAPDSVAQALAEAMAAGGQIVQVVEHAQPTVQLLAVRPSWVRVRAADGTVLFEKILDAGERFTVPQTEDPPVLRAGNPGALFFMIDGNTYGPAAPGAQVVDRVALSADLLRQRFDAADLSRDADLQRIVALAPAERAN